MKQILLIVFSVFLSFVASAQKIHFTDPSNRWVDLFTSYNSPMPSSEWHEYYHYAGDTVINTTTYMVMPCPFWFASYSSGAVSFIREDTILNKVFILINDTEQVFMDYNLVIGDALIHKDCNNHISKYYVSSIDSTLINSVYHKVWKFILADPPSSFASYYYVIEGIGCTNSPLYILLPGAFESTENLTCFFNNGTYPIVSPPVLEYDASIYFNNHTGCTVGINTSRNPTLSYTLSPNPAHKELTISGNDKITLVAITNLLGQTVYSQQYNTQQVQIDVADLPKGIYFIKVNGFEVRKFVKQ